MPTPGITLTRAKGTWGRGISRGMKGEGQCALFGNRSHHDCMFLRVQEIVDQFKTKTRLQLKCFKVQSPTDSEVENSH